MTILKQSYKIGYFFSKAESNKKNDFVSVYPRKHTFITSLFPSFVLMYNTFDFRQYGYKGEDRVSKTQFIKLHIKFIGRKSKKNAYLLAYDLAKLDSSIVSTTLVTLRMSCILLKDVSVPCCSSTDGASAHDIDIYQLRNKNYSSMKQNIFAATLVNFFQKHICLHALNLEFKFEYDYFKVKGRSRVKFDIALVNTLTKKLVCGIDFHEKSRRHMTEETIQHDEKKSAMCSLVIPYFVVYESEIRNLSCYEKTLINIYKSSVNIILKQNKEYEFEYFLHRLQQELPDSCLETFQLRYMYQTFLTPPEEPIVSLQKLVLKMFCHDDLQEFENIWDLDDIIARLNENEIFNADNENKTYKINRDTHDLYFCYKDITEVTYELFEIFDGSKQLISIWEKLANAATKIINNEKKMYEIESIQTYTKVSKVFEFGMDRARKLSANNDALLKIQKIKHYLELQKHTTTDMSMLTDLIQLLES